MMPSSTVVGALSLLGAAVLLLSRRPEYVAYYYYARLSLTLISLFYVGQLIYSIILYPIFFTPFKHLPTPPVSKVPFTPVNRTYLVNTFGYRDARS